MRPRLGPMMIQLPSHAKVVHDGEEHDGDEGWNGETKSSPWIAAQKGFGVWGLGSGVQSLATSDTRLGIQPKGSV